jgi:hypothetical protein
MMQGISGFGFSPSNPLAGYNPPNFFASSPFDVVSIAGQRSPGIIKIEGFKRKWKWDAKSAKGSFGEQLSFVMKHASAGTLHCFVWTEAQWDAWSVGSGALPPFASLFRYTANPTQIQAVHIDNPILYDTNLSQVVTVSLSPFEHLGSGMWKREIELIEWSPPPKVPTVATPTRALSGAPSPIPGAPSPTDPLQVRVQNLYQQLNAA